MKTVTLPRSAAGTPLRRKVETVAPGLTSPRPRRPPSGRRLFIGVLNPRGSLRGRPDGLEDLLVRGREGGLIVLTNDGMGRLR